MEFKQPTRQSRRSTLSIPERSGSSSVTFHPSQTSRSSRKTSFKARARAFFLAKPTIITGVVVVFGVAAFFVIHNITDNNANSAAQKPTYKTVLPKEKSINELGGWKRISPPGKESVYAFADAIDGVPISVSEQPLPDSFKNDVANQVAGVAQKFNATDKVDAGGIAVYIGTSSKGPQSVIFTKNNLLILIKSEKKIENTSWAAYAQTLG